MEEQGSKRARDYNNKGSGTMNFSLGEHWGRKYNDLRNYQTYVNFVLRENIKFNNFKKHWEILHDPDMYVSNLFIPMKNEVIFDIGSQYGDYALLWEKRYGAVVYAFELLENNYAEMLSDLKLNHSKIKPFNIAVGDGKNLSYTVRGDMAINEYSWNFIKTIRLDDLVFGKFNVKPNILKIDVEGFEYDVLKGAEEVLKQYSPRIIIETHSATLRDKCHEFLTEKGYLLIDQGRTVINKSGNQITNLFYKSENIRWKND